MAPRDRIEQSKPASKTGGLPLTDLGAFLFIETSIMPVIAAISIWDLERPDGFEPPFKR
jgi:hypothetical protein